MSENNAQYTSEFISEVYINTKSDLISITKDKLENILLKYLDRIAKKRSFITPLSLSITLLISLLTKETLKGSFLGISGNVWEGAFLVGFLICLVWTVISFISFIINWRKTSIDYLINEIKKDYIK
jgi:hypothetical protein